MVSMLGRMASFGLAEAARVSGDTTPAFVEAFRFTVVTGCGRQGRPRWGHGVLNSGGVAGPRPASRPVCH